jgi:HD-GYP domain-containing protein (c-di-GMP phosphodiesterase class II)
MTEPVQKKTDVEELITRLARSMQMSQVYGDSHDLTIEAVDRMLDQLKTLFAVQDEITIGIIGDELAYETQPLYEYSQNKASFIQFLRNRGVKKITFLRGLERTEAAKAVRLLISRGQKIDTPEAARAALQAAGVRHIALGDVGPADRMPEEKAPSETPQRRATRSYNQSIQFLTQTFQELKSNQNLRVDNARQIVEGLIKNLLQNKNLLLILSSIRGHDENMFMHGVNVSIFTLLQAEVLGLEEKYLIDMGMASLLHDVGKLAVSRDQIKALESKTRAEWTPEDEKAAMTQDIAGAKILLETEGIPVLASIVAFEHGMRYDMKGPKRKIYGKSLNLVSMMLSISDAYDQLRRKPAYYEEGGPEKAYDEMMADSGKLYHPDLLENFFSVIGVFPPGTLVELDTGEVALVIQSSMLDKRRPQVEIIYDSTGERYKEPRIVNLVEKDKRGQYKRSVVRSIPPVGKFDLPEKYTSES